MLHFFLMKASLIINFINYFIRIYIMSNEQIYRQVKPQEIHLTTQNTWNVYWNIFLRFTFVMRSDPFVSVWISSISKGSKILLSLVQVMNWKGGWDSIWQWMMPLRWRGRYWIVGVYTTRLGSENLSKCKKMSNGKLDIYDR